MIVNQSNRGLYKLLKCQIAAVRRNLRDRNPDLFRAFEIFDHTGSVYIASTYSNRVLRLDHDGQLASVAGGGDFITMSTKPAAADQVALNHPEGLWIDANGDLYFSDYDNTIIRRLDPANRRCEQLCQNSQANKFRRPLPLLCWCPRGRQQFVFSVRPQCKLRLAYLAARWFR